MDNFVTIFYNYFLQSGAGPLFENTNIGKQHKMFSTALNVLLTHIDDPEILGDHLDDLIDDHVEYGVIANHIDDFVSSFMKAIKEIFKDEPTILLEAWQKIVSGIMEYFRNGLNKREV